jgi:hypothetical protein
MDRDAATTPWFLQFKYGPRKVALARRFIQETPHDHTRMIEARPDHLFDHGEVCGAKF